jgi:hypothetical protein
LGDEGITTVARGVYENGNRTQSWRRSPAADDVLSDLDIRGAKFRAQLF